jgi:hypothetical protein
MDGNREMPGEQKPLKPLTEHCNTEGLGRFTISST